MLRMPPSLAQREVSVQSVGFLCKATFFKIGFVCMNLELNELDLIRLLLSYNEFDPNWFELDCIFDICRNLAVINKM